MLSTEQRPQYYQRPRELVSSKGFSVDYEPIVTNQELRDDIVSYLGEYRFELQKYDYKLVFSGLKLRDPHRLEAMGVKAERSIEDRKLRGESSHREEAEKAGISFLERQLPYANEGNTIVWASPPGSKEEGFGDYGFFFIGQIGRTIQARKEIYMTAIRVEHPTIEKYNRAFQALTGSNLTFNNADEFIRMPLLIQERLQEGFVDRVLAENFVLNNSFGKDKFNLAMQILRPRIEQFISYVKWGTKAEKKNAFHALENYSLEVKKMLEGCNTTILDLESTFNDFIGRWGFEPPQVKGSCPISSANALAFGYKSLNAILGQEWFVCPKCHYRADGPIGNRCPGCGLTKESYAEETGIICD